MSDIEYNNKICTEILRWKSDGTYWLERNNLPIFLVYPAESKSDYFSEFNPYLNSGDTILLIQLADIPISISYQNGDFVANIDKYTSTSGFFSLAVCRAILMAHDNGYC